jgi:hypothetical protein
MSGDVREQKFNSATKEFSTEKNLKGGKVCAGISMGEEVLVLLH